MMEKPTEDMIICHAQCMKTLIIQYILFTGQFMKGLMP